MDLKSDKFIKNDTDTLSVSASKEHGAYSSAVRDWRDSFKRQDLLEIPDALEYNDLTEREKTQLKLASQPYKKVLSQRHLTMISIGGTLGTGLFIGLGAALTSGPAALLIGYLLVGASMFCVIQSASELACQFPVTGSYSSHVTRFVDESVGFTVGTNYTLAWLVLFPSELIGCSLTISYWNSTINPAVWVAIFLVFVLWINLFGVRLFAETEFVLSIIKVLAIVIFIIIGIVLIAGGGQDSGGYIGTRYWHDPGPFAKPVFKNLCNTFVSAAFSYGGSEMVLLTGTESKNISSIARAAKGTFYRIAIFYVTTVVVIGCLVPYNDPRLLNASSSEDISASPFVIALGNTGSMGSKVSNFMNAIILVSVVSVCNSTVYASSRLIQALGAAGHLPGICGYMDMKGRPLVGIAITGAFGLLGFLVATNKQSEVFTWLFALCSIASFVTWFCICLAQVRFRLAMKARKRSKEHIAYRSMLGIYGGIAGCIVNFLLIAGEIYVSAWPVDGKSSAEGFFEYDLSIPIMIIVFLGHKIYRNDWKNWYVKRRDMDLDTGCSIENLELFQSQKESEKEDLACKPLYYRIYRFWC